MQLPEMVTDTEVLAVGEAMVIGQVVQLKAVVELHITVAPLPPPLTCN
ncbi:MAG: hypothetical protein KatS3mg027_1222 [Bacteroidia bacterium]|nr:MAG: hypothetical protein KatS3mg027_1222 [Bacteroidia bacterium]